MGAQGVGQGQIHVVAAEQDVLADADALERQLAAVSVTAIRLKSAVPPPTSQTSTMSPGLTWSRQPRPACGGPGVERRLRLFEQDDLPQAGGLGGFGGQVPGHLVEGGGDGQDDLAVGKIPVAALRGFGMEKALFQVREVAARALEGGELSLDRRFPRQDRLARIDVRVR